MLRSKLIGLHAWSGLRILSSTAGDAQIVAAAAGGDGGAASSSSSSSSSGLDAAGTPDRVAKVLAHSFHKAPKDTAVALLRELNDLDRIHLVLALQAGSKEAVLRQAQTQYVDDLIKRFKHSTNKQHNKLTRQQIQSAVMFQRQLGKLSSVSEAPASWRQLAAVGFASGLPFVVFGVLDNGIMLMAGEQIDALFGARMGLTMMASAGFGNLVADVVGVSATRTVQENIKRVSWATPPRLSMLQQQQGTVKASQFIGAALGVAVGCLIGMTPLLFMEPGFFVNGAQAAADAAAALADGSGAADTAVQAAAGTGSDGAGASAAGASAEHAAHAAAVGSPAEASSSGAAAASWSAPATAAADAAPPDPKPSL